MTLLPKSIQAVLIALSAGLVFGGIVGYDLAKRSQKSAATTQLVEVRKIDAANVQKVAAADAKLGERIEQKVSTIQSIKKEIASYEIPKKQVPPRGAADPAVEDAAPDGPDYLAQMDEVPAASCGPDFTVAHIRLLNHARAGAAYPGVAPSDAEKQTASSVDRAQFIQNDLDIVALYHELAEIHDQLVEEVTKLQAEQRKRLGVPE